MAKVVAFLVLLLISPAAYAATTHTVGGSNGWTTGFNYVTWANSQTFVTGDTLLFNFDSSHAVDQVNQADYQNCNIGNPITSYTASPVSISLNGTGTSYFICPRSNHCAEGMKLEVTVGSTSPGGSPSPSGAPGTPGTPQSRSSPPPPPPAGGAASIVGGKNTLMVGVSLVLAGLWGLMG